MKTINILEHVYQCENDAYIRLNDYLKSISDKFRHEQDIIKDIDLSVIEHLDQILSERNKSIVTLIDVNFIIQKIGEVESIDDSLEDHDCKITSQSLYRDFDNKIIGGVAAGIAAYFNISALFVRLIFIICFFTPLPIIIIYLLMWYFTPPALTKSEKLNMRGIPVNINSLVNSNSYTRNKIINLAKLTGILIATFILIIISIIVMNIIF